MRIGDVYQQTEHEIQCYCVEWMRWRYPNESRVFFAVPNGGKRSRKTAIDLKREGVLAGVSDFVLLVARKGYHFLCIEMKRKGGRQSDAQKAFSLAVAAFGGLYVLCYSSDDFCRVVDDYLNENKNNEKTTKEMD
mgnify:FL=1